MNDGFLIVNTVADDPFAIDVAHHFGQRGEIADYISLKIFANSECCPRFIRDEHELRNLGNGLRGQTVIIVSTCCGSASRNALAMHNFLIARAAKDNGAARVILVEPDLFYSAQDRGPRASRQKNAVSRDLKDRKKFDGQPFSARLYAQLLHASGVDVVVTVHNHSECVQRLFNRELGGQFYNLSPAELYCDFLIRHEMTHPLAGGRGFIICAPDRGAAPYAKEVFRQLNDRLSRYLLKPCLDMLLMEKVRDGERRVTISPAPESPLKLNDIYDQEVIVFDDMIRTGSTIMECCKILKQAGARRVIFVVTHFYSSDEVKENLNHPAIDEIVTTNTLPAILNRDMQGRLRKKMLVLKIEQWIANFLLETFLNQHPRQDEPPYAIDLSSKNPRWHPHEHLQD